MNTATKKRRLPSGIKRVKAEEFRSLFSGKILKKKNLGIYQIVIVQAGWVFYGAVTELPDRLYLEDCYNIRQWGTDKGLGQIALNGPTSETALDLYGTIEIPKLQVISQIDYVWQNEKFEKDQAKPSAQAKAATVK